MASQKHTSLEETKDKKRQKEKEVTQNQKEYFSDSNSSDSSSDHVIFCEPPKKRRRVCLNRNLTDGVLLHFINTPKPLLKGIEEQFKEERMIQGFTEGELHIYEANRVILKPTEKEKEEHRKKYREEYTKTHYDQIKAYQNSEKVLKRREEYNKRQDVKENKKKRAAARRKLLREFKNKDPEFYDRFMENL